MIITMTDVMIRIFHYVILVAYVSCYSSEFACAESSQLYILPTDHVTNDVSCPQNDCCTLNEWIESDLMDEIFTNEIYTVVLLPGVHVVNTTREGLFIYDIDSIAFTGVNGKAIVWCASRFLFGFDNIEEMEISNIVFKSCAPLSFRRGRNVVVANITIEQGGVSITDWDFCMNYTIHLYNLNISSSNSIGIYYAMQECDHDYDCTLNTHVYLQNCTLVMATIHLNAYCTQINVQKVRIRQILSNTYNPAFGIYNAVKVSLYDISIEDNTTPAPLLQIIGKNIIELKGHILFQGNKNNSKVAYIDGIHHLKIFPHSKIEFYGNSGIHEHLLELRYKSIILSTENYDGKVYIGGRQVNTNTSLMFKNNEIIHGGSMVVIDTGKPDSPRFFVHNSEFIFENNKILNNGEYEITNMAVLIFFESKVVFSNTSINNSVPTGGILIL